MRNVEYVIVGQGIAGILIAWELYKRGADFVVVSSDTVASSTKIAGGLVNPLVFRTIHKSWMFDAFYDVMCKTYTELEELLCAKLFHPLPSRKLISDDEVAIYREKYDGNILNCISPPVTNANLDGIKGERNYVDIYQSGWLNGELLMNLFKDFLIAQNVYVESNFNYSNLLIESGKIIVNELIADKVIFCEGAHIIHNPWFKNAGPSINKGELMEVIIPNFSSDFVLRSDLFVLPLGSNHYKVGATYCHHWDNDLPSNEGVQQLECKLKKLMGSAYTITNQWAGLRPASKDRKPILGPHPQYPSLIVFNGLGSKGFMQAPYWAGHLVDWLYGEISNIDKQVDVARYY